MLSLTGGKCKYQNEQYKNSTAGQQSCSRSPNRDKTKYINITKPKSVTNSVIDLYVTNDLNIFQNNTRKWK
jgi:hypothetical protein